MVEFILLNAPDPNEAILVFADNPLATPLVLKPPVFNNGEAAK